MKTLYTYLKNERRVAATANDLQIHRNTLISRIKMIEEIMDINLDDVDIIFHLYLTFKILIFTKSLNFKF
ncbi:helix-turn-helix domain-containing protein [Clostridium magnum]|uniref:PucR family transcriptional regulator n=1 Tax=Clostridium magnum TaxID=33954 RepID=UPI000934A434